MKTTIGSANAHMNANQIKQAISQAIAREERELGRWEDLMMDDAAEFSRNTLSKLKEELDAIEA